MMNEKYRRATLAELRAARAASEASPPLLFASLLIQLRSFVIHHSSIVILMPQPGASAIVQKLPLSHRSDERISRLI